MHQRQQELLERVFRDKENDGGCTSPGNVPQGNGSFWRRVLKWKRTQPALEIDEESSMSAKEEAPSPDEAEGERCSSTAMLTDKSVEDTAAKIVKPSDSNDMMSRMAKLTSFLSLDWARTGSVSSTSPEAESAPGTADVSATSVSGRRAKGPPLLVAKPSPEEQAKTKRHIYD